MWKLDRYQSCLTISQRRAQVEINIEQKDVTDVEPDPLQMVMLTPEDAEIVATILHEYAATAKAYHTRWGEAGN